MDFFRISKEGRIYYTEIRETCIEFKKATKTNKRIIISFIRSVYYMLNVRLIIEGVYKVIYKDGHLIGIQFDMNYLINPTNTH